MTPTKRPPGRPRRPESERMVRLETTIRQDQLDWLNKECERTHSTRAEIIRDLIDDSMALDCTTH